MATFTQWRTAADRGIVKRITWVCGSEVVLREEVIDFIRSKVKPEPGDYIALDASDTPERDVWAACNQYPADPSAPRLVLVRDAERLKNEDPFLSWIGEMRLMPTVYLVFVADEPDLDTNKPHLAAIRDSGTIVRCATPNEDDLVKWVQRRARGRITVNDAHHLLTRVGGDLGKAANVLAKAAVFEGTVTESAIDLLVSESPGAEFADLLVQLRKQQALLAAEAVARDDYPRMIGLLDVRLDLLSRLNRQIRNRATMRDMARETPAFVVHQLLPAAREYDDSRVRRCRQVLAVVDDGVRSGARDGALEALVACW